MADTDAVTRRSALAAIEHVAIYNGESREREAVEMLVAAPAGFVPVAGPVVRRIERTYFPNSTAHKALSAFCHAMHDRNIDGADMRAAMLWFLGLEECEEPTAAPTTQPAPQQEPGAVHQFRKQHCADWYDGNADHSDGRGPYEERTLYTLPKQEPVMIYHGDCTIDCGEHGHHHVELLRMIPAGSKLYTTPQPSPSPASQGDALPREEFAWLVVQEACETEPADEDDPECIRILRRDLKSSVLAAFLRHDAARAAQEGK